MEVLKLLKDTEGATMVEYALMVMLIAVFCVVAVQVLGVSLSGAFEAAANAV